MHVHGPKALVLGVADVGTGVQENNMCKLWPVASCTVRVHIERQRRQGFELALLDVW